MTMSRWTWTALALLALVPSARGQGSEPGGAGGARPISVDPRCA
jgi:hypothetical protein